MKAQLAFMLAMAMVAAVASGGGRLGVTDATAQANLATASVSAPAGGYDGETLYRGLAFGQGPVAALLPELDGLGTLMADQEDLANAMVAAMASVDATFFSRFAREIQSGDRVRIKAALREADELGAQAASQVTVNESPVKMVVDQSDIIVLVLTVVVVIVLVFVFFAPSAQQVTPLDRDIAADRIARVLSVGG